MNTHAALRVQEVNPARLTALYRKQFELCKVKPGETIAVGDGEKYKQQVFIKHELIDAKNIGVKMPKS